MKKIALATLLSLLTLILASCFWQQKNNSKNIEAPAPTSNGPSGAPHISAPPGPPPGQK